MGYKLSWLSVYDSCDSQKMFIRKVRLAALKACSVMDECISRTIEGVWELYVLFIICSFPFPQEVLCDII